MVNSVDADESARLKLSHQNPHCLHRYLFRSAGLKMLKPMFRTTPVILLQFDHEIVTNLIFDNRLHTQDVMSAILDLRCIL